METEIEMNTESIKTKSSAPNNEINPFRARREAFCHLCRKRVGLITEENAVYLLQSNEKAISRLISRKAVHRIHNSRGERMICENALKTIERCFRISRTISVKPIEIQR